MKRILLLDRLQFCDDQGVGVEHPANSNFLRRRAGGYAQKLESSMHLLINE
jgi:hypothetical protein